MNGTERIFLDAALKYKREYETTKWWKFKKKRKAYNNWQNAIQCMVRYG